DPDIARDAEQLKTILAKCAIGATKFNDKFSHPQLERMVKRDLETRFKKDAKYSQHVRNDVPGSDVKEYGPRGRTSSKGTFVRTSDYLGGGGLDALLTGGWMRIAKDRIDPHAWSHQHGLREKQKNKIGAIISSLRSAMGTKVLSRFLAKDWPGKAHSPSNC